MNSKFLVIDMMGSSGHVSFNTWYLNQKVFNKSIFMSNKKLQKDYPEINIADIGSFKENISAKKGFISQLMY